VCADPEKEKDRFRVNRLRKEEVGRRVKLTNFAVTGCGQGGGQPEESHVKGGRKVSSTDEKDNRRPQNAPRSRRQRESSS